MYIITGISRGLGKALVAQLLEEEQEVLGIGRSNPFGASVQFISCDLSDAAAVKALQIPTSTDTITLINNAGVIGEIARISEQGRSDLEEVMQVNVFAPMTLTRKIYRQLNPSQQFHLVNISSGAANRSIPSWSAYCASKAALNRLTENFYLEEMELGRNVTALAIAPGVIDTDMQAEIRSTSAAKFSSKENFVQLKEEGKLFSPKDAANRLLQLLKQPFEGKVFQDLREM